MLAPAVSLVVFMGCVAVIFHPTYARENGVG